MINALFYAGIGSLLTVAVHWHELWTASRAARWTFLLLLLSTACLLVYILRATEPLRPAVGLERLLEPFDPIE